MNLSRMNLVVIKIPEIQSEIRLKLYAITAILEILSIVEVCLGL